MTKALTPQQVFDRVWKWFVTEQNPRAVSSGGKCMLRTSSGAKCAIGIFIPDEMYSPGMEEDTIVGICNQVPFMRKELSSIKISWLSDLQRCHDGKWNVQGEKEGAWLCNGKDFLSLSPSDIEGRLRMFASEYTLSVPGG